MAIKKYTIQMGDGQEATIEVDGGWATEDTLDAIAQKLKELGVDEALINLKGMTQGMLVILGQKNIKKINDFADLSSDELIGGFDEIKGKKIRIDGYLEEFSLSRKEADDLIMAAREIAYN